MLNELYSVWLNIKYTFILSLHSYNDNEAINHTLK